MLIVPWIVISCPGVRLGMVYSAVTEGSLMGFLSILTPLHNMRDVG